MRTLQIKRQGMGDQPMTSTRRNRQDSQELNSFPSIEQSVIVTVDTSA
jgi:hypothetical protein